MLTIEKRISRGLEQLRETETKKHKLRVQQGPAACRCRPSAELRLVDEAVLLSLGWWRGDEGDWLCGEGAELLESPVRGRGVLKEPG